jgi:2-phosphoglycerate kinase
VTELADLRWIGGGSGAGKSTVALRLGVRLGIPVVQTDVSLRAHAAASAGSPEVDAFVRMSMDERWVHRDPAEMLHTFPWFEGAGFDLLLEELLASTGRGPVLVEGFRAIPRLVAPLLESGGRGVWLLPTPERRAAVLRDRAADRAFWTRTSDPERALANVLERDRLFTERVGNEARSLGLPVVEVDGSVPLDALVDRVAEHLGLGGARQQD